MLASGFTPVTVQFSSLEKNRKGGKVVFVGLPGADGQRQKILLQTPTMALPFGVSPYQDAATGEIQSYSLDASFRGSDSDPRIADFLAKMRELDEVTLDVAVANSKEWFGKPMSKEIVSEFHRKLVKDPANPQYAPVIKFKVQLQNGQPNAMFFDEKRQPCDIDYFTKGTTFKGIIELDRIWFVNKVRAFLARACGAGVVWCTQWCGVLKVLFYMQNFGCTWRLVQAMVVTRPGRLDSFAFQADDEDMADAAAAPSMPSFVEDESAADF